VNNIHGLDVPYFREKLEQLARDCEGFTPYELYMALRRLEDVLEETELKNGPKRVERGAA
jgi:hypothetical protein